MNAPPRILVIDDSPLIHQLVGARLSDLGVQLSYARTGNEGLQQACRQLPDLILLDINLTDMTGFEVCRLLKHDPRTHDLPIIFLTGAGDVANKICGFDLGAVDYVVKPFDPPELRARVRAALRTKALMDMLTEQAAIDGLSGLHNRRYFDQRLDQESEAALRYHRHLGLLLIDIDHFKQINDRFGHPKGDQIIQRFAELLRFLARQSDVPCRYGGDEFALILPEANYHQTCGCGRRLIARVTGDPQLQSIVGELISVSVGGASTEADSGIDPDRLICRADQALYQSKRGGRGRCTIAESPASAA